MKTDTNATKDVLKRRIVELENQVANLSQQLFQERTENVHSGDALRTQSHDQVRELKETFIQEIEDLKAGLRRKNEEVARLEIELQNQQRINSDSKLDIEERCRKL